MKTKFNFNSQICTTREQSERILVLGIKKGTADCYLFEYDKEKYKVIDDSWLNLITDKRYYSRYKDACFPAWSLNRLIEMMPPDVIPEGDFDNIFTLTKSYPSGYSVEYDGFSYYHKKNIYDTLIEGIEDLIKQGYFNKEYLYEKYRRKSKRIL